MRVAAHLFLAAGMAAGWAPAAAEAQENAVDLELVLAVDVSGSIDDDEAVLQREGFVEAFRDPHVLQAIQAGRLKRIAVSVVEWAGATRHWTLVDWRVIEDAASAEAFAAELAVAPHTSAMFTSISGALAFAAGKLAASPYASRHRVIDVSGDGPNNDGEPVTAARDRVVARGVTINGLPIINGRPSPYGMPAMPNLDLYYRDCVIGGPGAFIVVANGFKDFARAIRRKLILEIAGLRPRPPQPGLRPVAARESPPCDAGEQRMRQRRRNF